MDDAFNDFVTRRFDDVEQGLRELNVVLLPEFFLIGAIAVAEIILIFQFLQLFVAL